MTLSRKDFKILAKIVGTAWNMTTLENELVEWLKTKNPRFDEGLFRNTVRSWREVTKTQRFHDIANRISS